jgi:hypothetical protein
MVTRVLYALTARAGALAAPDLVRVIAERSGIGQAEVTCW